MTPHILTHSGINFPLLEPQYFHFNILDIAHSLSQLCRFTGHTRHFYSVAQHSVIVASLVPPDQTLAALMHDAAEAYLGDVSSPLKALLPDYKKIEANLEIQLRERFGLPLALTPGIKRADLIALRTERRDLMPAIASMPWPQLDSVEELKETIRPWSADEAKQRFLHAYEFKRAYFDQAQRP